MVTESSEDLREVENEAGVEHEIWAVIVSGYKTYVGRIGESNADLSTIVKTTLEWFRTGQPVTLQPAYEISVAHIPVQTPNGMAVSKQISSEPFLLSFCESSPLHVIATGISLIDEMEKGDQARYKTLIQQASKLALNARAGDSGLVLPK